MRDYQLPDMHPDETRETMTALLARLEIGADTLTDNPTPYAWHRETYRMLQRVNAAASILAAYVASAANDIDDMRGTAPNYDRDMADRAAWNRHYRHTRTAVEYAAAMARDLADTLTAIDKAMGPMSLGPTV